MKEVLIDKLATASFKQNRVVVINTTAEVLKDYKQLSLINQKMLDRLKCPACHSGFVFKYRQFEEIMFGQR